MLNVLVLYLSYKIDNNLTYCTLLIPGIESILPVAQDYAQISLPKMKVSAATLSVVLLSASTATAFLPNQLQTFRTNTNTGSRRTETSRIFSATEELPDVDKTSVEIDQHKLSEKWRRPELFGQSIIEQTMQDIEQDEEFQQRAKIDLKDLTKEERTKRRRALDSLGIPSFNQFLSQKMDPQQEHQELHDEIDQKDELPSMILHRKDPEVLQINVGLYCNQACQHCHVDSSPLRKETMSEEIAARCITLLKETPSIHTLDITGGAPELNESFRYIVAMAREFRPELDIIDRCNLTVLQEPGQDDLVDFLVEHKVHVIASLPCYSADNVDKQRGNGVFDRSISALLALNESGYGIPNSELMLDLVYNPLGAFLPPSQEMLEAKYKEELAQNFGIVFNSLYTMTNIPVKRFTDFLYNRGELKDYMDLLVRNFNPDTMDNLMCGNTVSVGYDGKVFDCDFNQQLGYTIGSDKSHEGGKTVFDIESLTDLKCDAIKNDNHCFGCTAGNGSS